MVIATSPVSLGSSIRLNAHRAVNVSTRSKSEISGFAVASASSAIERSMPVGFMSANNCSSNSACLASSTAARRLMFQVVQTTSFSPCRASGPSPHRLRTSRLDASYTSSKLTRSNCLWWMSDPIWLRARGKPPSRSETCLAWSQSACDAQRPSSSANAASSPAMRLSKTLAPSSSLSALTSIRLRPRPTHPWS